MNAAPAWSGAPSRSARPARDGSASRRPALPARGAESSTARRRGVAVFPTAEGLHRYLIERDGNVNGRLIVALEGRLSEERDLDADAGALLVHPERILEVRSVDEEIVRSIQQRLRVGSLENGGIESA